MKRFNQSSFNSQAKKRWNNFLVVNSNSKLSYEVYGCILIAKSSCGIPELNITVACQYSVKSGKL